MTNRVPAEPWDTQEFLTSNVLLTCVPRSRIDRTQRLCPGKDALEMTAASRYLLLSEGS